METGFPFHVKEHRVASQHVREYPRATAGSQEDVLYLAVKQYVPKEEAYQAQPGDVTILGTHANGFPKELYEALWCELLALSRRPGSGFRIRGVWIADMANQGASSALNEGAIGDDPSWNDHARDLLHLTNVFRADMPRPIVGVGHSFGANILAHLALLHPRLLSSLVLLDATITRFTFGRQGPGISPARSSIGRRELWPSRAAAAASFRRSAFYRSWDPRVLDAWVRHGVRPTPTVLFPDEPVGAVTLATTKHQEVFTYFRPVYPYILKRPKHDDDDDDEWYVDRRRAPDFDPALHDQLKHHQRFPFYRAEGPNILRRLPELRPSVLWLFGGTSDLSDPASRDHKLASTGTGPNGSGGAEYGRVKGVVLEGKGHLFPMEVPGETAGHVAAWLGREVAVWREDQDEFEAWAAGRSYREKSTLDEEFVRRARGGGGEEASGGSGEKKKKKKEEEEGKAKL